MKVLSVLMLFVLLGVHASAQQQPARVIAEVAAGNEKMVKNSPFSAEAVSESVQTLADGNRIVRTSTTKLYRNSEGRFRREMAGGSGALFGTDFGVGHGISILDPVVGHRVTLDSENRTARIVKLEAGRNIAIGGHATTLTTTPLTDAKRAELEAKLQGSGNMSAEQKEKIRRELAEAKVYAEVPSASGGGATTVVAPATTALTTVTGAAGGATTYTSLAPSVSTKYETRTEDLGTRDFEGVSATGTRRVTTIPAGAIGNERPIETVYERWYSKELEMVVYSKRSDPRVGEQTYRLTNINRSEPDPSLFTVPPGYRTINEPPHVYRIPAAPVRTATAPRTPQPVRAVTVNASRP